MRMKRKWRLTRDPDSIQSIHTGPAEEVQASTINLHKEG